MTVHYDAGGRPMAPPRPGGPTRDAIPIPADWFFRIVDAGHYAEAGVDPIGYWVRLNNGQHVCPELEETTP